MQIGDDAWFAAETEADRAMVEQNLMTEETYWALVGGSLELLIEQELYGPNDNS